MSSIAYVYDPQQNLVRARAEGRLLMSELLAYVRSIVEDEAIQRGFVEIVDFEPVDDMTITYSEISPLPQIWKKYLEKGVRAVILYAPGEVAYGVCRMFQAVIVPEADLTRGPFTIVRNAEELGARLAELGITDA